MRSIGKVKIKRLNAIVAEEAARKDLFGNARRGTQLKAAIEERIPDEWYDTWEMAWSEINRLIDDAMWKAVRS